MRILLGLVFVLLLLSSCDRKDMIGKDEYVTLSYKQTFCADAWGTVNNDSVQLANLSTYLANQQLYIASLNIKQETAADLCNACTCKTGKVLYVTTLNSSTMIVRYQQIGFTKQ